MYFNKKFRNADKEIRASNYVLDSEGDAIINVKACDSEHIFSQFNFDSNEKLNPELEEYIVDKAKSVPLNKDIKIKIYTEKEADQQEVASALKNNFKKDYWMTKEELKRTLVFSLIMFLVGTAFLISLLFMHKFFYNNYLEIVLEIVAWVFIWEAVDSFFLQRSLLKRVKLRYLKLYLADIEVIKLSGIDKLN